MLTIHRFCRLLFALSICGLAACGSNNPAGTGTGGAAGNASAGHGGTSGPGGASGTAGQSGTGGGAAGATGTGGGGTAGAAGTGGGAAGTAGTAGHGGGRDADRRWPGPPDTAVGPGAPAAGAAPAVRAAALAATAARAREADRVEAAGREAQPAASRRRLVRPPQRESLMAPAGVAASTGWTTSSLTSLVARRTPRRNQPGVARKLSRHSVRSGAVTISVERLLVFRIVELRTDCFDPRAAGPGAPPSCAVTARWR